MADPFVVDDSFKKKIATLKVTELHNLLRNLGQSYQANKDQLVKRVTQKYIQIYEQYRSGVMSYEEAKIYGDWVNENHMGSTGSAVTQSSSRSYYQPNRPSGKPSVSFNISGTSTNPIIPSGYNNNNNHYTSNNYAHGNNSLQPNHSHSNYSTHSHSGHSHSYQPSHSSYSSHSSHPSHSSSSSHSNHSHHGHHSNPSSGYSSSSSSQYKHPTHNPPPSGTTLKSLSEVNYKPASELIFPKSADPFLEIETTITHTRLKTHSEARGRPTSFNFQVPDSVLSNVKSGAWRAIVRCFEVQNNLSHVAHPHVWPTDCTLSINGTYMNLGIKKQTKPNAPPHPDKPLDISKEIRVGRNTMDITNSSSRTFAIVIDTMRVISVETLIDVVMKNKTQSFESAKKTVSLAIGGGDSEIAALHTTVSLQCPLVRTPLVLPAKSLSCRHIQCFDLRNYLMMNQRTPSWKCPVCSAVANTNNLVVDSYFTELLRNVDSSVHSEIHITPSGDWSTVKPKTPKQEPIKPTVAKAAINIVSSPPTSSPQKAKKPVVDVVDLISDDEDEVVPVPKKLRMSDTPQRPMPIITSLASPPASSSSSTFPSTSSSSKSTIPISVLTHPENISTPSPSKRKGSISTSTTQSSVPTLDLNSELPDPYSSEAEFQPNLGNITSDLDLSPPTLDLKKRPTILVKLKAPPESSPQELTSSNFTSSTLPFPPPPPPPPPISAPSESSGSLSSLEVPRLAAESNISTGTSSFFYSKGYHTRSPPLSTSDRDYSYYHSPPLSSTSNYGHHEHYRYSSRHPAPPPSFFPSSFSSSYIPPDNTPPPPLNHTYNDYGDFFDDFEPQGYSHYQNHYSSHYGNHKTTNNQYNSNNDNKNYKNNDLYETYTSHYSRSSYHDKLSEYSNDINHYHPASEPSFSSNHNGNYPPNNNPPNNSLPTRVNTDYDFPSNYTTNNRDNNNNNNNNNSNNNNNNNNGNSNNNYNSNHDNRNNSDNNSDGYNNGYSNNNTNNNNDYSNNHNNNDNYDDNDNDNSYNNFRSPPTPPTPPLSHSRAPSKPFTQAIIEISDDDGDY